MSTDDRHSKSGKSSGNLSSSAGAASAPARQRAAAAFKVSPQAEPSSTRRIKLGLARLTILFAIAFTARYLYWRATETMNPAARWFFYAFLLAEILNILEAVLFYITTWAPTRYSAPEPVADRTVDVFITTYNEPLEMLRETVLCATGIQYPHQTFILDDGDRPEVKQLASELGCRYLARRERTHAKAGNLNNALRQTSGEFIVTLDADHVPSPDLIDQLIGFFRDDEIAAVQTAQDFYNLDSFQHRMTKDARAGWQQQELFFNVIQPGKDSYGAAFYCGSPAMLRRSALNEIGGFATETVTEDMHTGLRLQKKKMRVLYHNRTLAFGLAPQTFIGFATQWQRWGFGCMQVMRDENPLLGRGLSFGQRLCYFASMYFYWMSYQKLFYILTPIFALMTGIFPLVATPGRFVSFFLPFFVLNVIAAVLLQGGFRSYIRSEQFNMLKMHVLLSTVLGLFRKKAGFKVTPKSRAEAASLTEMLLPVALCVMLAASIVVGAVRLAHATDHFVYWALAVNICWAGFYVWAMAAVVVSALRRRERRMSYRFPSRLDVPVVARIKNSAAEPMKGYVRNLNRSGMSMTLDRGIDLGTVLALELQFPGRVISAEGEVVRHTQYQDKKSTRIANGIRYTKIDVRDQDEISKYLFWRIAPRESSAMQLTNMSQREV